MIVKTTQRLIEDKTLYEKMAQTVNPYGDGTSAKKIVSILINAW
jgi:UDP-N-acetylglucosamine 2-epimerase (non-hydrolysing)